MEEHVWARIRALGGEGIIDPGDLPRLTAARARVLALMLDGQWHSAVAIRKAAGVGGAPASEGLRRLRELRDFGFEIDRRRVKNSTAWDYLLIRKDDPRPKQMKLEWNA